MISHRLITPLTVHRPTAVADDAGGQTITYTEVGQVRAQVSQPSVDERRVAAQLGTDLSHVIHTSYDADVLRGDHLAGDIPSGVPGEGRLRVISVVSNSRRTYLRLEAAITQTEGMS